MGGNARAIGPLPQGLSTPELDSRQLPVFLPHAGVVVSVDSVPDRSVTSRRRPPWCGYNLRWPGSSAAVSCGGLASFPNTVAFFREASHGASKRDGMIEVDVPSVRGRLRTQLLLIRSESPFLPRFLHKPVVCWRAVQVIGGCLACISTSACQCTIAHGIRLPVDSEVCVLEQTTKRASATVATYGY